MIYIYTGLIYLPSCWSITKGMWLHYHCSCHKAARTTRGARLLPEGPTLPDTDNPSPKMHKNTSETNAIFLSLLLFSVFLYVFHSLCFKTPEQFDCFFPPIQDNNLSLRYHLRDCQWTVDGFLINPSTVWRNKEEGCCLSENNNWLLTFFLHL